jgi:cysteine desulfuration protein SufE
MKITEVHEQIVSEFELFSDWEERYQHLISLGSQLAKMPDELKTEKNLIKGCQSQVWLHAGLEDGIMVLQADSDALIVKGLVSLVLRACSGFPPSDVLIAGTGFIERIGLSKHLSVTRSNGLAAMIKQINMFALVFKSMSEG